MKLKQKIKGLLDIGYYIQGNVRYRIYHSKLFSFLIPKYIKEQYEFRLIAMDKECYDKGSCKKCGCQTTALQMANKPCEENCYLPFLSKDAWNSVKRPLIKSFEEDKDIYNDIVETSNKRYYGLEK